MAFNRLAGRLMLLLPLAAALDCFDAPQPGVEDRDRDGIPDALEQQLADRYAPVVYHAQDEPNLPTDVNAYLPATELWYFDASCRPASRQLQSPAGPPIPRLKVAPCRAGDGVVDSWNTRSAKKERTFFLRDVASADRAGSRDSTKWTTYFHAYPNSKGGITIQYWRFHSYNTSELWGRSIAFGSHGGDWEAVHLVLGPKPDYRPEEILLLGHRDITRKPFSAALEVGGAHILIHSGKGGHTTSLVERSNPPDQRRTIRQESWSGGQVRWPGGGITPGGKLVNLGEKNAPMPGMEFLRYSGLWGTRREKGWFAPLNSGYWGPAYNETGMTKDGFIMAWCVDAANTGRAIREEGDVVSECYGGR
jgi:hypothetical protein